ncbi:HDOD domain-containing protein [bacterium]|nr:HDOD domain-containing protein [bacterium]
MIPSRLSTVRVYEEQDEKDAGSAALSREGIRQQLRMEISRRVREGEFDVPMLPHVAAQVLQLASQPDASAAKITHIIEQDQFISGRLIYMANSPVFRGLHEVTNVKRAVIMMGLKTTTDLILSISLQSKIFRSKDFMPLMQRLWRHSLGCAFTAQEVARVSRRDSDSAFLCGLLHDIGKPLMIDTITRLLAKDRDRYFLVVGDESLVSDLLDEFHAQVGGLIARRWKFPDSLVHAIAHHHEPIREGKVDECALLTGVADLIAHRMGFGDNPREGLLAENAWVKEMGITPEKVQELESRLPEALDFFFRSFV